MAIGADLLFSKGRHVKSLSGKGGKNSGSTQVTPNTPTSSTANKVPNKVPTVNTNVSSNSSVTDMRAFIEKKYNTRQKRPDVIDRISLNVHPDESLIRELDDFITRTGVNVEYKVPQAFEEWLTRHDPIKMYFRENVPHKVGNCVFAHILNYFISLCF